MLNRVYIHYINRYVSMQDYMSRPAWHLWRYAYLLYILPMLRFRRAVPLTHLASFARLLLRDSASVWFRFNVAFAHEPVLRNFLRTAWRNHAQ